FAARGQGRVLQAVVPREQRQQRQLVGVVELLPARGGGTAIGVDRAQLDAAGRPRRQLDVGAQADGGVQGRGTFVEQIQGPDVDGAARQIDAGRRGSSEAHGAIIRNWSVVSGFSRTVTRREYKPTPNCCLHSRRSSWASPPRRGGVWRV